MSLSQFAPLTIVSECDLQSTVIWLYHECVLTVVSCRLSAHNMPSMWNWFPSRLKDSEIGADSSSLASRAFWACTLAWVILENCCWRGHILLDQLTCLCWWLNAGRRCSVRLALATSDVLLICCCETSAFWRLVTFFVTLLNCICKHQPNLIQPGYLCVGGHGKRWCWLQPLPG